MALRFAPVILRNAAKLRCTPSIRNFGWRSRFDSSLPTVFNEMNRRMQEMEREMMYLVNNPLTSRFSLMDNWKRRDLPEDYEITQVDGSRKMRWQLDLSVYKPEEIKVTIKDKSLIIHAKTEECDDKGGKSIQEYYREVSLPDDANLDSIKSLFNDGILKVEVDLPRLANPKGETVIPVQKG